jgi:hypothetical protein
MVISASPTQAQDTVESIKHRLVFPSNKHFISFLTTGHFLTRKKSVAQPE